MQIYSVTEVLGFGAGALTGVKGRIKTVADRTIGNKNGRDWSVQSCVIQDPQNQRAEIKVKIWNREELDKRERGKVIYFTAGIGKKNGDPVGLKLEEDTYRGKTNMVVSFNDEAEWGFDDNAGHQSAPPQQQRAAAPPPQDRQPNPPATRPAAAPSRPQQEHPPAEPPPQKPVKDIETMRREAVQKARANVAQRANLFLLCMLAADYVCDEYEAGHPGRTISPEQRRTMASSIHIGAERGFVHQELPSGRLSTYLPDMVKPLKTEQPPQQ